MISFIKQVYTVQADTERKVYELLHACS